jgi:cardiolipin synthase (CMP-forming)
VADTAVSGRVLTVPNLLSVLRLLLVPVFVVLIVTGHDGWGLVVLAASSASDFLDGHLARRWDQVTRLGQLLDPAADRLYVLSTLVGLALRGLVPWWVVALVVARDVVLLSTVPVLARAGYGPLPVHHLGKAATFCLLNAFPLILLAEVVGVAGGPVRALGWALAWWGTALYWWAGLLYLRQVRDVVRRPPVPAAGPAPSAVPDRSGCR